MATPIKYNEIELQCIGTARLAAELVHELSIGQSLSFLTQDLMLRSGVAVVVQVSWDVGGGCLFLLLWVSDQRSQGGIRMPRPGQNGCHCMVS